MTVIQWRPSGRPWTNFKSVLKVVTIILFCLNYCSVTSSQDLTCCAHSTGSCRTVCENVSLVQLAGDLTLRNHTVHQLQLYCSNQLVAFWECLNATINDMSRGDFWPGRRCCPLPYAESCRRACVTAASTQDLIRSCRQSDEIPFYNCVDKQLTGQSCCGTARNVNCRDACNAVFRNHWTPTKYQRQRLKDECELTNQSVLECVKDIIKVTPVKNTLKHMQCCDKSNNIKCRESCRDVLSKKTTFQEIIDGLQLGGCGLPLPQDKFWQCFIYPNRDESESNNSMEISRIEKVGMDSAKWHCCQRANSTQCSRLCSKTFTKSWATSWDDFHHRCLNHVYEESLRNCIDEVDEPCELGCDGLSFCTNFNNRPTELFRSCTFQADDTARNEVTLWQSQRNISMPGMLSLPLKSDKKCWNIWKAVACTLQIKPCSRQSHANQICRDVCLEILKQCTDWSRLSPIYSAEKMCQSLSPDDPGVSCIKVNDYLAPNAVTYPIRTGQVSSPCKGNPCDPNEICIINKDCIHGLFDCKPYNCLPSCKLGEVSQYMVPDGTYVRIPIPNNPRGCLKICKCTKNKIEECQPLLCVSLTSCLIGNIHQMHGSTFEIDCNSCSCYAGELICGKRQCENNSVGGRNTAFTTLPCNCPPHYVPVCGRNGITYPSACLAKCSGLTDADIELMSCQNPCKSSNACPIGQKCVPKQQTCLSLMHKPCKQYECINGSTNCANLPKDPVCDVDNQQYDNSCLLAHHNVKLAYRGPCLKRCHQKGQVCGINGKTYSSECAAHADMISVDYEGPCLSIGLISRSKSHQCSNVKCPKLPNDFCLGIHIHIFLPHN
ncbi:hypothetical protein ABEB36_008354 [Hypothenemus hampei]|uniref:Kazal-like domain-containing protein n=1 Tax=Hypothenemus hampei TaxID=57062 RepID=A0ABD1ELL8_HYPHA